MPVNQTGVTTTSNWICPASGTLNVRIKSANGCYYNASFLVQNITNIYNQLPGGFQGVDSLTSCTILSNIINVNLPASINISAPGLVCNGSTAQFTGNITVPGNIVWYDKATGGSPISTGNNFTTTSLDTSYTVYAARNYMGCESQRIARTANVQGKINVKISSSGDTICENSVIQLTASNDLQNATYTWNNGLGAGALKSFRPSQTDSFRVVATVNGCRDTAYKYITVKSKSSFNFGVVQCAGSSYTFNGNTYTTSGTYQAVLSNAAGCDSTITLDLIINPLPTPTITQNGTELSTQNFSAYQWKLNNNNIAGANSKTFTPSVNGEYSVEVTDNNSCKNISEPFTVSTVGLFGSTKNQLSVKIFPNPANEQLMLTELPSQTKIQILTMEGKILYTKWNEQKSETITTKDWSPGVYLISLEVDNMKQLTKIFITH
jgi:hypothetical protein